MISPLSVPLEPIGVTGIGLVSALGATTQSTWQNLISGQSGLAMHQPFLEVPALELGLIQSHPATWQTLMRKAVLEAIADAQLDLTLGSIGVVMGSSRGNQHWMEAMASDRAPREDWLSAYSQSPSQWVAQLLSIQGPILSPRAACATGLWAIAQGAELIRSGQCQVVIAGAVEAPITPLTIAGFQKMGALSNRGAHPFDQDRSGFVLAEGAAIFILESPSHAQQRHQAIYGEVLGFGATDDAVHISAPSGDRKAAIQAVQQCLQNSHLTPDQVGAIHAHGTGTRLNDAAEADIIKTVFTHQPWVTSTKGATGHSLGASGALGVAFSLLALRSQLLPPCTGLNLLDPAFCLNVSHHTVDYTLLHPLQAMLCFSFGFGGQNAVLGLSHVHRQC